MTTAVVEPVLQPITLANTSVREKAEDFGGAAPRDAEDDFKVAADKPKDASTLPIVKAEEDKENAAAQEEQTSLSVSDNSMVPKVTPAIDDTVLAAEIPTELGMDKKVSSIPVTVALTSDMVSSSVLAVEHSEDAQVKNDNELASVTDSPNEEISSLPASVTPQPTKADSIPVSVPNPTFEDQVKFVAPEQLDFSSRPSDVKTDVVAIDDVAPDVLEDISSADKATMPDDAPVAAGGIALVEDATVIEPLQAAKDEAILGEESLVKEEHPEVTAPMVHKEPGLKDVPVLDSAQSPEELPTAVATSIVQKDAVIEDAIVIEKAPFIEEEERVAPAEGTVAVEAAPATVASENFEAPSAAFLEGPIPEKTTVQQLVSADVTDKIIAAEETTAESSAKIDEQVVGEEDLQLATMIATKTTPQEEALAVSANEAATAEEGEAAPLEAEEDELEKTPAVEADSAGEVKGLNKGGSLPSVERHESPSPLAEETLVVEAAGSKEAGPPDAVIEGSSTSAVIVPPVEEPTSAKNVSIESAKQVTVEQPSTATVLTASVVSGETLLRESVTSAEVPAVEEKVVSNTPNVKVAPITVESLGSTTLTSVTEDPLAVPSVDNASVTKISSGEAENDSSTPVVELAIAAEVDLTIATDEPAQVLEPLEEAPVAYAPFVRQPSAVEAPVGDKSMVAVETSASEVAFIPAGDTSIEEATGEPTVVGIPETEIPVETTSVVVDETRANHMPVAISVPTKELEASEAEIPVEKQVPVDDSLIVEEITAAEELSAVEQGVQVFNISKNPLAIEEILEEASVIGPSPTAEDDTIDDKTSSVVVGGVSVAELSLNENVIVKPDERVIEPHTSASPDPVVEEVVTPVAEPTDVAETVVAVVTSPVEYVSLYGMPTAGDAVPLVDKAKATPTAVEDLPAEQEGENAPAIGKLSIEKAPLTEDAVENLGEGPVAVDLVEKVDVIDEEAVEVPLGAHTEKVHTKDAPIEGTVEMTAEANPVVAEPQDGSVGVVSHEERIGADEPSIVVEKINEDGVHAAPSSGTGTAVDEAPGIMREGAEEDANTQLDNYVPSGQETSSTESIVASLVEENPQERETLAQVDQSVIEDNTVTGESLVVDTTKDSTPIAVIEAPVVIDKVDPHETELTLPSTASLDEVTVNLVTDLPLTERESNIDAGSHSATLLTPAGAEIEHPKSPWTPSYSVTSQGPGIPAEEDIPAIEDLSSSLSQVLVVALTPVDSSTPLDEVQTQSSSEISEDRPKSPWTPSYSVSVQGSPLHGTVALDETEQVNSTVVADVSVADEPASSQTDTPGEAESTTELTKDESQEEETLVHPQSTLTTEEHLEAAGEAISTYTPDSVIEKIKTTDDSKLPIEEEHTLKKELTTDTGIDRPASSQAASYSATEGIVSMASEAESTLATSLVHESAVYEASSQVEESPASQVSIHEVADKSDVTIIPQPVVVAEDTATSESTPIGAVRVEVRDLHAVETPVEPVASPPIELQSNETDSIASTPELDDEFEKPADVKVDVESYAEEIVLPSEKLPAVQEPVLSSTPSAHGDAVVEQTPEFEELSVPSTTVPEVQSVTADVGAVVAPQTYISAEDEVAIETLPTVDELPKDVFVETASAQLESDSVIQEVITTPEPVSEAEVTLREQVGSSEELLAPATELERPASPWTPSYSVTQQGLVTPTSEVETNLPTSGAAIDAPAPTEPIVQAEPSPEGLSTSVGPSIELPQAPAVVSDVSDGKETIKEDSEEVHPSTADDVEILHESDTTLLRANAEIDRPSSPWTPSYSVTQQGRASPAPGSDVNVELAENEVPSKDEPDDNIPSLIPEPQHQVESAEPVIIAHTPVPMAEDERINDEPKLPIEGEIASSVLEHVHEVNATQEELLGQADASSTIPAVKEAPVAVTVPPPGPEVHAVIASTQEPEVEHVVKEEPAESIIDIRAVPTVPEPGNDLEPTVEDDTVSVGKHQEVTTSSSEPARDMEATVNGKQAEEGHKEEVVLTAPELEYVVESSVKDETVVSEPLTTVGEKESKGGERVISHAQVLVDEIKSVLKDEPGDEEATSRIPASIEKEQQAETGHIRSPEVESVVNDELVREEDANLPSSVSTHDSKPALEDMSVEDKTELHVEKALSSVPEPILQNAAPEAGRETESAVKEEAFEDEHNEHNDHIVSPAPVSVAKEEYDEQIVPPAEESLAEGETAGEEHQQAAIVYDSEQQIDTVVEDKQVQDVPVVQDELVKEGQDNENILASSEPAVEDKHSQEPVAAPLPKLEREIESVAVDEPVANDIVESVVAPEPEPYVERVVEAKVEHVATPAPDLHHEIETVEKEVEESAEIVLDEQVALPVPEPESAVAEDETIASPAPVETKSGSTIVDDSALLQGSDIESKANDELIEVPVTKEVLGPQDDATLPAPEAEPRSVAISEEGQIEVVREIEPAEEVETGHGAAEEEHDDQEASTVLAKDEPTHAEQVAVLVPETDQRTEVVVHAKEAEDRPVSPELVAEDGLDKDGHDEKAVLQDEKPSGHDEEIAPPAPEVDTLAKEESLEDEQATSSTSQPTPVSKEDPAVAESVPEKEVKEPVPEPAVVQGEVIIPPAPEPATETKPLEEVALAAPELHSAVEEKSLEDDQTLSPAAQPAPALKEQVDVEPVPELQQETKAVGKEVDEPVADIQEQLTAPEPAVVEEEPVISPAPEPATEIKSLVVEVDTVVEPEAEEGIESVVKDEDQPAVPPVAEIKNEPVISPTPELVTEAKFLEPTAEPDVEEQAVVPVAVSLAPEIVAEVESVDEASAERYVEPKAEDVQVEIKSAVKDEQVEDKPEEPIAPEREPVSSEQAASPEPQQEQAEKIEVELAKEEPFEPVVKEEQVEAVASEEKTSLDEQVHVEPAEEASDDKLEAEPTAKDEDVEENTIDSRELSVDTSSFADSTKSPWTPSHSMTTQDVGSPDAEMKKDLPGRAFPVTEEDRKSVGSLDTVNESADVVPETLEVPFTRKRLESSASARLLRGALHKVPEGRASLDMAQGEFTKLPSPVVVDTTHTSTVGVAETPTAEQEPASASTDDSDGSSDDSSEAEHKGRWCVVM